MPGPRLVWMAAALVAAVATGCGGGPSANGGRLEVSILGSTTNVRLDQPFPAGAPEARLLAARNEFESAQIAVEAQGGGVKGVDVSLAKPLSGPGGSIPADDVTIYREGAYTVDPTAGTPPPTARAQTGCGRMP